MRRRALATSVGSRTERASIALLPTRDGNAGALALCRHNGELVAQPPRTAQAEAHPLAGGVAVLQRQLDVRDAGSVVLEHDPDAAPCAILHDVHGGLAALAVVERVARQFAGRGDDLGLIDQSETRLDR